MSVLEGTAAVCSIAGREWAVNAAALVLQLDVNGELRWRDLNPGKNRRIVQRDLMSRGSQCFQIQNFTSCNMDKNCPQPGAKRCNHKASLCFLLAGN